MTFNSYKSYHTITQVMFYHVYIWHSITIVFLTENFCEQIVSFKKQ
jgi:hypothetical protein